MNESQQRHEEIGRVGETDACPACGSVDVRTLFRATDRLYQTTSETFYVVECAKCRLIRLYPWPEPHQLGRYYPANYWYVSGKGAGARLEEIYRRFVLGDHVRFVRRAIEGAEAGGVVLDVGCGGGLFLHVLRQQGHRVAGLDFSCDAAAAAWSANGVPAVCATLSRAPFSDGSCSVVTMFHVLEHLYNPASYLEAAHRLLLPGGRLVVQVPNAGCWQFLLLGEHWSGLDVPRHLLDFRVGDLESLLAQCGFEILRIKHFSLRDNPAGFATSLAPGLDPMARRIRGVPEGPKLRMAKDLLYFSLVAACVPFTLLESACRAGSTIMVEARKKP